MTTPGVIDLNNPDSSIDPDVLNAAREVDGYGGQQEEGRSDYEDIGAVDPQGEVRMWSNTPQQPVVILYRTESGEPVPILGYLEAETLGMLDRVTGKPRFSRVPVEVPKYPRMLCLLHPDHPQRALWNQMGLPFCRKSSLRTEYQVQSHMRMKHQVAHEIISVHETKLKDEEWRAQDREARMLNLQVLNRVADAALGIPPVIGHTHAFDGEYPVPPGSQCTFIDERTNIRCPEVTTIDVRDLAQAE